MKLSHSLLVVAGLAVPARAQVTPSMAPQIDPQIAQGLFSNLAVGMTVIDANENVSWWIRAPGVNGGVPVEWNSAGFGAAAAGHPDFSFQALTQHWTPAGPPPEFGGISTGGEIMPTVNASGRMTMTVDNWYMLSVAVDSHATGLPGSLLANRAANNRNPAGDILAYYAIGSTGIHPAFPETVRLEDSREQLALQAGAPATAAVREIRNHDFGLGVVSADPRGRAGTMFPVRNCFYFTLTQAWVDETTLAHPGFQIDATTPNASTVYVMTWSDTSQLQWSAPRIAFDHATLFPNRAIGEVEIDALSVDKGGQTPAMAARVVFSLTPDSDGAAPYDQILVYQRFPWECSTTPLMTDPAHGATARVSDKLGLRPRPATGTGEPDNVGSTCGGDPREPFVVGPIMGIATSQNRQGGGTLGLTMVRESAIDDDLDSTEPMQDVLHVQVTGLGHEPHALGFVGLFLEGPAVPPWVTPAAPVLIGDPIWIDTASEARNSLDVAFPIPADNGTTPMRVSAQLFGVDFTPSITVVPLRESWVLAILP